MISSHGPSTLITYTCSVFVYNWFSGIAIENISPNTGFWKSLNTLVRTDWFEFGNRANRKYLNEIHFINTNYCIIYLLSSLTVDCCSVQTEPSNDVPVRWSRATWNRPSCTWAIFVLGQTRCWRRARTNGGLPRRRLSRRQRIRCSPLPRRNGCWSSTNCGWGWL